jgi:hypothetical protein
VNRHADLLRSLAVTQCPACLGAEFAETRFVAAFVTEAYADYGMRDRLRASRGFCPEHTRLVLRQPQASWVLQIVYADVVRAAVARRSTFERRDAAGECPLCASRTGMVLSWLRVLVETLGVPAIATAYREMGGLCVAHARAAVGMADRRAAQVIVAVLIEGLAGMSSDAAPGPPLIGPDPDADVRYALRRQLGGIDRVLQPRERTRPILEGLAERVAIDACPVCLAGGLGERVAVSWLQEESIRDPDALASDGLWLCARHLHDAWWEDETSAVALGALVRGRELGELTRLRAQLAARRLLMRSVIKTFVRGPICFVCAATALAEEREAALLVAALHDRPTMARFEGSHGVCLYHVPVADCEPVRRVLSARLAVLEWELEEAGRQAAWPARHEVARSTGCAWRRAPGVLDGRAFLGGPAVVVPPPP